MSIISVQQRRPTETERDEAGGRRRRYYVIVTDDPNEDERNVALADGVPRLGDSYRPGSPIVVTNKHGERNEAQPRVWYLTAEYGLPQFAQRTGQSDHGGESPPEQPDLPELEAPVIHVTGEEEDRVLDTWWRWDAALQDYVEEPAVNSAGLPFPEGFIGKLFNPVVTIERNIAADRDVLGRMAVYSGTYCRAVVLGVADKFARMMGMSYQKMFRLSLTDESDEEIQTFWRETLTIKFHASRSVLNQSDRYRLLGDDVQWHYHWFSDSGRTHIGLLDGFGQPLNGFDGNGKPIGELIPDGAAATYITRVFESKPITWDPLDLPESLNDMQATIERRRRR